MNAYLELAEKILRNSRRPLRPRAILDAAYRADIVPSHLHGKTQHKTLQARLSEDILEKKDRSVFFRTSPGHFFLREFISDKTIPIKYRRPMTARRRTRELIIGPALTIPKAKLKKVMRDSYWAEPNSVLSEMNSDSYSYVDPKKPGEDNVLIWSFSAIFKDQSILCYRQGRYRENRNSFKQKKCVGFSNLVSASHRSLFSDKDQGIIESGLDAAITDLDIPSVVHTSEDGEFTANLECFLWSKRQDEKDALISVIRFDCPNWFEPTENRLSINDLHWMSATVKPNNIDDFDPWSRLFLNFYFEEYKYWQA